MFPESGTSILDPKVNKSLPTITWSQPPQGVVLWDEPFLLALLTDSIEVRVLDTSSSLDKKDNIVQIIPVSLGFSM